MLNSRGWTKRSFFSYLLEVITWNATRKATSVYSNTKNRFSTNSYSHLKCFLNRIHFLYQANSENEKLKAELDKLNKQLEDERQKVEDLMFRNEEENINKEDYNVSKICCVNSLIQTLCFSLTTNK